MKIARNELDKYIKLIKKNVYYAPTFEGAIIFFPIETSYVEEDGGFELTVDNKGERKTAVVPGLTIEATKTEKGDLVNMVRLAYADLTYANKFDFLQFVDFYGRCSRKDLEALCGADCLIVEKPYVKMIFEL